MSFVGDLFSSDKGAGFQAERPDLLQPTDLSQRQDVAYNQSQNALDMQQAFINALASQRGVQNQADIFAQQQALAQQLQQQAAGQGPNPAQAALQQATGQNVAAQAALMAGQRGTGANAGLLARQIAQQGAGIQQQAVGQSAIQQAQQQLAAQQQLQAQQQALAGLATQQVGQQQAAIGNYGQFAQGLNNALLQAMANQNQARIGAANAVNAPNAEIARGNQKFQQDVFSGLTNSIMGMPKLLGNGGAQEGAKTAGGMAHGGQIKDMRDGGHVPGKGKVAGDSYTNDTVPAVLSPKEIVIPRSIAMHPDAPRLAAEFVAKILAKNKGKSGKMAAGGMAEDVGEEEDAQAANQEKDIEDQVLAGDTSTPAPQSGASADWGAPLSPETASGSAPKAGPTPTPTPAAAGPMGGGAQLDALQAQQAAIQKEAAAQGALGREQAKVYDQAQEDLRAQTSAFQAKRAELDAKTAALTDDIKNGKIDPNRLIADMGTGQRVATAIGMIIGGLGGNDANKYLQTQIDRDVDAQKANLDNKNSLLNHYLRQGADMREAENMTKASMLEMAKMKLDSAAAKAQGTLAGARAAQASAQIGGQIGMLKDQMAARAALGSASSLDPYKKISLMRSAGLIDDKAHEQLLKEAGEAQKIAKERDNVAKAFNQVLDTTTLAWKLGHKWQSISGAQAEQMNAAMAKLQKTLAGRFNAEELKMLMDQFRPTVKDSPDDVKMKYENLMSLLDSDVSFPYAARYNVDLTSFGRTKPTGEKEITLDDPVAPRAAR